MTKGPALFTFFAVALLGVSSDARADNGSLAEALFRDARQEMAAGNYASAYAHLAESQRLDPSPGTRLNLATCAEREGRIATAWSNYRATADELPSSDPRVPLARERAAALEPRLSHLRISLPPDAPAATIAIDGTALGDASVGVDLPVDPGAHLLVARTQAGERRTSVTLAEGERRDVVMDLDWARQPAGEPGSEPRALTRPEANGKSSARRIVGWTAVTTGAVGVLASFVLGALVMQKKSDVANHCHDRVCDHTGLAAAHDGTIFQNVATASFVIGLPVAGLGGYLVVSAPSPAPQRAADGASLVLTGRF